METELIHVQNADEVHSWVQCSQARLLQALEI